MECYTVSNSANHFMVVLHKKWTNTIFWNKTHKKNPYFEVFLLQCNPQLDLLYENTVTVLFSSAYYSLASELSPILLFSLFGNIIIP